MDKKELTKIISSFVIGDGALSNLKQYKGNGAYESNKIKNSKYYLKQLAIHKDYVEWQAEILENITQTKMTFNPSYIDSRGYSCKEQLSLYTKCHPFFTEMRKRIYINNKKTIDPHYLKLWDAKSLAILYMDNGWLEKKINKNGAIYYRLALATHTFSYGDNMLFKKLIKEKYSIEFDIMKHKQKSGEYKFYLRNSKDNSLRFIDLVSPFILPSFEYKINKSVQPTPFEGEDIV